MYKLLANGGVIRLEDGAHIPNEPSNSDWQRYLVWLSEGHVPEPVYSQAELDAMALAAYRQDIVAKNALATVQNNTITARIAVLQDSIDLEMATPEEEAEYAKLKPLLIEWKKYRIYLGRMDTSAIVAFPVQPELYVAANKAA